MKSANHQDGDSRGGRNLKHAVSDVACARPVVASARALVFS